MTPDLEPLLRRALFNELAMVQVGMLGLSAPPPGQGSMAMRPMVHLMTTGQPDIWFLAEVDSDLVKAMPANGSLPATYCLVGHRHTLHACLTGPLRQVPDRRGLEKVWSITAESWFPGGLGDIEWTPLRLQVTQAHVWLSRDSAVVDGVDKILPAIEPHPHADAETVLRF